ncbi:hypothetical protein B0H13DRAFT_2353853 [Mycena leptocephala]|nr:hypothetical protein B0H13DRAFT_2353853 [Mycena leptocephala]
MVYSDGFAWTPALVTLSNQLWAITAIIGAALCGAVLVVIGIVALNPVCRPHLDRVSFRVLVWALAANTVFGITNAIGGKFTGPTWTCGLDIWLLQLTLELSSFLLFSIALIFSWSLSTGQWPENGEVLRWGSVILSLALTVPPYALKQYGWDPLVEDCWYSNDDPKQRLAWQIGTQLFWSMLAVTGEIVCTSTVVIYMLRHQLRKNRVVTTGSGSRVGTTSGTRSRSGSGTRSRSGSVVSVNNQVSHANAYRGIIFRIGGFLSDESELVLDQSAVVYPISSALFNLISVVYRVLLLSDFVYGGRSIMYALLAATDPALVRAVTAFIQHSRGLHPSSLSGAQSSFRGTESKGNLSVHIKLSTIHIEEAPLDTINLQGVQVSSGDLNERSRIRVQEDRARRQQQLAALNKERQDFQKRI